MIKNSLRCMFCVEAEESDRIEYSWKRKVQWPDESWRPLIESEYADLRDVFFKMEQFTMKNCSVHDEERDKSTWLCWKNLPIPMETVKLLGFHWDDFAWFLDYEEMANGLQERSELEE